MPKVSNSFVQIDGKRISFDIHYNKTNKFHLKAVPEALINAIKIGKDNDRPIYTGLGTEDTLIDNIRNVVSRYHEKNKTSRKIIWYQIHSTTECAMNQTGDRSWSGRKPGISNKITTNLSSSGYGFVLTFEVYIEVNDNGLKYFHINQDGSIGYSTRPEEKGHIIDWTIEREQSLYQIYDGIELMLKRISSVLCDPEKALQLLDSNQQLFLK